MRHLPSYPSAFFGREREKRAVLDALAEHRLVTIGGLGGFGKTRLAVEAAQSASGFDPVAFVSLAHTGDVEQFVEAIRAALRMEASGDDPLAQLCAFLREQRVLLVLDNFEQLVDQAAPLVLELLERLPRLHLLVTSRRVLDVPAEHVLAIDPLPVPEGAMDAAQALATPSVALFVDRARGARADFALTDANRPPIVRLCRALEGLPLAIEIAASRIRTCSPAEMCDALSQRFAWLTRHGSRGARYGRHASLQATIEWSWNLLDESQQRFFAALTVFRDGWTATAVEDVCQAPDARARLDALVCDSLLRAETDEGDVTRFSLLETLREFARERVAIDHQALRARHAAYFLHLARACERADAPIGECELANVKQALSNAIDDRAFDLALELCTALRGHWETRGATPEELRSFEQAAERCARGSPRLHEGLMLLSQLTFTAGDSEHARRHAERALSEAGEDSARRAAALVALARTDWERGSRNAGVIAQLDEALGLASSARAGKIEADAWRVKATVALRHGSKDADYRGADALFERAEALYRKHRHPQWAHRVMLSRAACLAGVERYDDARRMLSACERYFAGLDSAADLIAVANMAGYIESGQEHWREAVDAGRRCVELAWERHAHLWLATALWNLPHPLAMLGEAEAAAKLMPFAARFWEGAIGALSPADRSTIDDVRSQAAKRLGAKRCAALWRESTRLSLGEAVALALGRG